jgi:hypothetical protein
MWTKQDSYRSRRYTCELLSLVEDDMIDKDTLIRDLLGYLSESEVADFARKNDLITWLDREDEEEDDRQPDEAQEWADFDPDC